MNGSFTIQNSSVTTASSTVLANCVDLQNVNIEVLPTTQNSEVFKSLLNNCININNVTITTQSQNCAGSYTVIQNSFNIVSECQEEAPNNIGIIIGAVIGGIACLLVVAALTWLIYSRYSENNSSYSEI